MKRILAVLSVLLPITSALSQNVPTLQEWMARQKDISQEKMLKNISAQGTSPGSVIASPSRENPDYFYHWTRDAALVMESVLKIYQHSDGRAVKADVRGKLVDFVHFSRQNQLTENPKWGIGLEAAPGEPKYHVNGKAYEGGWGRPQNDGPALRASMLIKFARQLLQEGEKDFVAKHLYKGELPATTVIKADLEFVSHHWNDSHPTKPGNTRSHDLWEEVRGDHFYTRMVQYRALADGAAFAKEMGDPKAAAAYSDQADLLKKQIDLHWNGEVIRPTLNQDGGHVNDKKSHLDTAVVLAALHAEGKDGFYNVAEPKVLASANRIKERFREIYGINKRPEAPGVAIGRYPEDRYNGNGTAENGGNPWVLTTAAFAEMHYRLAQILRSERQLRVTEISRPFYQSLLAADQHEALLRAVRTNRTLGEQEPLFTAIRTALLSQGDAFMARVRYHAPADGALSEQMNRNNGFQQGARDLTWSYAAYLTAFWAKNGF